MLRDYHITTILYFVIGIWTIIRIVEWRINKNAPPLRKAYNSFVAGLLGMGILVAALWLSMPSGFYFEAYGLPESFKSLDELHAYLQKQNREIARLRDIVFWFFFFFGIGLLQLLSAFAKAVTNLERNKGRDESLAIT